MATELNVYTGRLTYHNIEFFFVFDKEELRLIPPEERHVDVEQWVMQELGNGIKMSGLPVYIDEPYLKGVCSETNQIIIFIPSQSRIGRHGNVLLVPIEAYIIKKFNNFPITSMSFKSSEIDCIHPVRQAMDSFSQSAEGIWDLKTKSFEETTTEKQAFLVDGREITVHFGELLVLQVERLGNHYFRCIQL